RDPDGAEGFRPPDHQLTTGLFVLACAAVVIATVASSPPTAPSASPYCSRASRPFSTGARSSDRARPAERVYVLGEDPDARDLQSRLQRGAAFPDEGLGDRSRHARAGWRKPLPLSAAARGD